MSRGTDGRLALAEYLIGLQAELSRAHAQAEKGDLKFSVDGVTLEVDVSYSVTQSAESPIAVKPEFWVSEFAADEPKSDAVSHRGRQRLTVRLNPRSDVADLDETKEGAAKSVLPWPHLPER